MYLPNTVAADLLTSPPASRRRICQSHFVVALPAFVAGLVVAKVVATFTCRSDASAGEDAFAMQQFSGEVCEKETGGTCFFSHCDPIRNAVCSHPWSRWQWHECVCRDGQCAGLDGKCHSRTFPQTVTSWLRQESYSLFFLVIPLLGRSGLDGYFFALTGLDRLTTAHRKITTKLLSAGADPKCGLTPWRELVEDQELSPCQVFIICAAKLMLWHVGQVLFFWSAWLAYCQLMGWGQFIFATVVVVKEAWYMVVLAFGTVGAPHFLLYAPFSAQAGKWLYMLSPCTFVVATRDRHPKTGTAVANIAIWCEVIGATCAWIALAIGLASSEGVMYPSLFCGYILSGVSPFGMVLWMMCDQARL